MRNLLHIYNFSLMSRVNRIYNFLSANIIIHFFTDHSNVVFRNVSRKVSCFVVENVLYTYRRSNKRRAKTYLTKYTSHFICKGSKRLINVCV